ncbi:MAG TPA: hypothetical protein VHZ32_12245 [Rhizomicrobium sp.]|nr:hypothetical protein [Rhizomicrobium sp.]
MRTTLIPILLLLAGAPALAATPAAVQAEQSPTMPGADAPMGPRSVDGGLIGRGGGKLGGLFTPEQRAMYLLGARDQVKDMTQDQRHAWRKEQVQKVMAMSDTERTKLKADLQAKWDALPQGQKDRIQQRLARGAGGNAPAQ